jgi:hypothetical protein
MEPTVIREEVQAFLQACQAFAGFKQFTRLTTVEHKAIDTLIRTLGSDLQPSLHDQPRSFLPVDG